MSITFKDDVKKNITKTDLPSNIKGRKLGIQFELKNFIGIKVGSVLEVLQPIVCHSIIGEKMGVDVQVTIPMNSNVLFAGIDYCNVLKHMVLVLVFEEKVVYLDYDKISIPGFQAKILNDYFKILIK